MKVLTAVLLAGLVAAESSNFCNDGWDLYETEWQGQQHHSCFWFGSEREKMSHNNAKALCESMGAFMAEVPYGPHLNNWIVNKLIEKTKINEESGLGRPDYGKQYWLGARDFGHHNDHMPGHWMWEHRNSSVEWFDWGSDEPNNFNGQNCLTYLRYEDVIFGFATYKWNDWDCDQPADFICEIIVD